jgi:hypothetical protein
MYSHPIHPPHNQLSTSAPPIPRRSTPHYGRADDCAPFSNNILTDTLAVPRAKEKGNPGIRRYYNVQNVWSRRQKVKKYQEKKALKSQK